MVRKTPSQDPLLEVSFDYLHGQLKSRECFCFISLSFLLLENKLPQVLHAGDFSCPDLKLMKGYKWAFLIEQ